MIQGVWASLLTLSGTYSQLLDYIMFASLLFYLVTLAGMAVLRKKMSAEHGWFVSQHA